MFGTETLQMRASWRCEVVKGKVGATGVGRESWQAELARNRRQRKSECVPPDRPLIMELESADFLDYSDLALIFMLVAQLCCWRRGLRF